MQRWLWVLAVLAAGAAHAASPFDGVWVADLKTDAPADHTDLYLVKDGQYRCDSCRPPRAYAADGQSRPVPGDPGVVTESVRVSGARSIVTRMVEPDMVREVTMTADPDDQTATYVALDTWPGVDHPLKTVFKARRTAPTPAGAHPVSGSWKAIGYFEVPEEYRSITLSVAGGQLTSQRFRGGHFTAAFGGPAVTLEGALNNQLKVSVSRIDAHSFRETLLFKDKPSTIRTYVFAPDGQSMRLTTFDVGPNETIATTYRKK